MTGLTKGNAARDITAGLGRSYFLKFSRNLLSDRLAPNLTKKSKNPSFLRFSIYKHIQSKFKVSKNILKRNLSLEVSILIIYFITIA